MRGNVAFSLAIVASVLLSPISEKVVAQSVDTVMDFTERNLSGPRLGLTFVPGDGELRKKLDEREIGTVISQFGWHWEHILNPGSGGPAFVTEFILLAGGVEYGTLIPSATLALEIRAPSGLEFGLGPNIIVGGEKGFNSALVIAIGKSFDFSGVSIPVNLAYVTSPAGSRIGFIVGYAIQRSSK